MDYNIEDKIFDNQALIERICFSFCLNAADREDLFQEIVFKVLKGYKNFKGESSFSTWLYRISLNTAITFKGRKKHETEYNDEMGELEYSENDMDKRSEIEILYKAIDRLKKMDKAIIILYLEERTYEEIAEITGFTVKNISVKIVRLKRRLHDIYQSLI